MEGNLTKREKKMLRKEVSEMNKKRIEEIFNKLPEERTEMEIHLIHTWLNNHNGEI